MIAEAHASDEQWRAFYHSYLAMHGRACPVCHPDMKYSRYYRKAQPKPKRLDTVLIQAPHREDEEGN